MGLAVILEPSVEPVSVTEAAAHLRVETHEDDDYLMGITRASRALVENYTRRALVTQTMRLTLDSFCCPIRLPRSPVQSVSAITYLDTNGTRQTLSSTLYQVDASELVATVFPTSGSWWPQVTEQPGSVRVDFVAGYGLAHAVPEALKQAIKLIIGTMYDGPRATILVGDSVSVVPHAAEYLMGPYRIPEFCA